MNVSETNMNSVDKILNNIKKPHDEIKIAITSENISYTFLNTTLKTSFSLSFWAKKILLILFAIGGILFRVSICIFIFLSLNANKTVNFSHKLETDLTKPHENLNLEMSNNGSEFSQSKPNEQGSRFSDVFSNGMPKTTDSSTVLPFTNLFTPSAVNYDQINKQFTGTTIDFTTVDTFQEKKKFGSEIDISSEVLAYSPFCMAENIPANSKCDFGLAYFHNEHQKFILDPTVSVIFRTPKRTISTVASKLACTKFKMTSKNGFEENYLMSYLREYEILTNAVYDEKVVCKRFGNNFSWGLQLQSCWESSYKKTLENVHISKTSASFV